MQSSDSSAASPARSSLWWRIPLRVKSVLLIVVPAAALCVALFAVYRVEREVQSTDNVLARAYQSQLQLAALRGALLDVQTSTGAYLASPEPRFIAQMEAARLRAGDTQAQLAAAADPTERNQLEQIRTDTSALMARFEAVRKARDAAGLEAARTARADLQARIARLSDLADERFAGARARRDDARSSLFRTLWICAVFGFLGAPAVSLLLAGRMVGRLRQVEENAWRLATGQPLAPTQAGTDEIASLSSQMETAADLLRKRQRELTDSERRYRDLFDHAPVPYEETDREGTIRRVNQAACTLLRCAAERMIGRPAWDMASPDDRPAVREAILRRISADTEAAPYECQYILDDGTHLTVEVRENLIFDQRGEIAGTVRSMLDVTERNMAALAARKVSQYAMELRIKNEQLARTLEAARSATLAKSRFLASVSHELRTPLNGIIGFSELLFDQRLGPVPAEQLDVLADILASSRHLLQLINDILDLSKIEAGRMEFYPELHRLHDLVAEVRDVVRPLSEKKNLALTVEVPLEISATLDGSRFKQVVYNYLSNAVKFTADGGSIAVRVRLEGEDRFRLEVEDNGYGIDAEELPRLFQEFGQLPNSRKAGQGTGLGLALTRHLVEAQGGKVGVRSQPGQGSVFFAVLPLVSANSTPNT